MKHIDKRSALTLGVLIAICAATLALKYLIENGTGENMTTPLSMDRYVSNPTNELLVEALRNTASSAQYHFDYQRDMQYSDAITGSYHVEGDYRGPSGLYTKETTNIAGRSSFLERLYDAGHVYSRRTGKWEQIPTARPQLLSSNIAPGVAILPIIGNFDLSRLEFQMGGEQLYNGMLATEYRAEESINQGIGDAKVDLGPDESKGKRIVSILIDMKNLHVIKITDTQITAGPKVSNVPVNAMSGGMILLPPASSTLETEIIFSGFNVSAITLPDPNN